LANKKWVALGLAVIIAVAVFGVWAKDALVDSDGDGIMNYSDAYPTKYNFPASAYAEEKSVSTEILDDLACLDSDCELDEGEKLFVDYLSVFGREQQDVIVQSFLADKVVSFEEVNQIRFLNTFAKEEQVEMIENGSFSNFDWDGDHMNNYFEKEIAHLPYDVYNGRYVVLLDTFGDFSETPNIRSSDSMYQFLTKEQKIPSSNIYNLIYTNATKDKFRQVTEELSHKVNGNDLFLTTLVGHGLTGVFAFNDGQGQNQNVSLGNIGSYMEIDSYLDKIKSYATVITLSACYCDSGLEPLKEGPSSRVVLIMTSPWFFGTSKNYLNSAMSGGPKQYYYIKPEDYDIDGNGYVSVKESWDIRWESQQKYFSQHPEEKSVQGLRDISNISSDLYLGDFSLRDSSIDVPESYYNPCPDYPYVLYDAFAVKTANGYSIPIEIRNYGSNSSTIDPMEILYDFKEASEYGAFSPKTNYDNLITLSPFGNPGEFTVLEITLQTGEGSPWQPGRDVAISMKFEINGIAWNVNLLDE
jgi:hypothetical protein